MVVARDPGAVEADAGTPGRGDAGSTPGPGSVTDGASPTEPDARVNALCGTEQCACSDGQDNDGDGLIDSDDPQCTGPFDHDEQSLGTGLPNAQGLCQDCFFDGNASTVDDGCEYHRDCLGGGAPGPGGRCDCEVGPACVDTCRARTPNGCDCFGCCLFHLDDGNTVEARLDSTCALDTLEDPTRCQPCVRDTACANPCGECELCPGRGVDQLPAGCRGSDGEPGFRCDDGNACDRKLACRDGFYCLQGCCIPIVR